jgi:hypothetical protein
MISDVASCLDWTKLVAAAALVLSKGIGSLREHRLEALGGGGMARGPVGAQASIIRF